jgi:endonuclease-3
MQRSGAIGILDSLKEYYPGAVEAGVQFENPFQALILTILSAQTTDRQVGTISDALFRRFTSPRTLAYARQEEVEAIIRPTGFYHVKSRNIIATARMLLDDFHGEVPHTIRELLTLPGVGRKTANIVMSRAFGVHAGIAVDTHVFRIARRIGFSDGLTAGRVERDLTRLFPRARWGEINAVLITHGRRLCTAKSPKCPICPIRGSCRYYRTVLSAGESDRQ